MGEIKQKTFSRLFVFFPPLPVSHVTGHGVQSLKGVMIQSFLQGSWHGRTVLGRGPSGHLGNKNTHSNAAGDSLHNRHNATATSNKHKTFKIHAQWICGRHWVLSRNSGYASQTLSPQSCFRTRISGHFKETELAHPFPFFLLSVLPECIAWSPSVCLAFC